MPIVIYNLTLSRNFQRILAMANENIRASTIISSVEMDETM
ncbi:hypothetical protein [Paenibacillus zanthoxyli]|nr:hypothetical protein [Paenibacillus zanthoxyli]